MAMHTSVPQTTLSKQSCNWR